MPFRFAGAFAGLSWKGLGLVALLCLVNALRRNVRGADEFPPGEWLGRFLDTTWWSLVVALPITFAVVATHNLVAGTRVQRYCALAAAVLLSSLAGTLSMVWMETGYTFDLATISLAHFGDLLTKIWLRYALLGALFTTVYVYLRAAEEGVARAREAELDRARYAQQMEEAQLQMLQAQIEPHFLFNTLATIRRLYRSAPSTAAAMLDDLMRYLATALPQMRERESTLGREATLAEAYLNIQRIRMEDRLAFEIDVPEALRGSRMPPMMLLTLVENAIKHGVDALPEGGRVRIAAAVERDALRVQVVDSGRGFVDAFGSGTGLANVRARLAAQFGRSGRLELAPNPTRGVTATLVLPLAWSTTSMQ